MFAIMRLEVVLSLITAELQMTLRLTVLRLEVVLSLITAELIIKVFFQLFCLEVVLSLITAEPMHAIDEQQKGFGSSAIFNYC